MPKLPFYFAKRYLFSRKSFSAINIISGISSVTVAVPVMSMVILLSVFNGFDGMIKSMYKNFDPELKITASEGRFLNKSNLKPVLENISGIASVSFVMDENALFGYRNNQYIGMVRGVDSAYEKVVPIENMVVRGEYRLKMGDMYQALVGQGIAYSLQMSGSMLLPLDIYVPKRGRSFSFLPSDIYNKSSVPASGIYALDNETDGKYLIVPLELIQQLSNFDKDVVTAALLSVNDGININKLRNTISEKLGQEYRVQTRFQQKESFYRLMQYEKWGIYFIILMVMVIASFSVIGSLTMIIIDKKKDTETLLTIGASPSLIRKIFITEGLFISGTGMAGGLILGLIVCLLQIKYGFIEMSGRSFMVDAYPVKVKLTDLIGIVISVFIINLLISYITVKSLLYKKYMT